MASKKSVVLHVRVPESTLQDLDDLSLANGWTRSIAARQAISAFAKRANASVWDKYKHRLGNINYGLGCPDVTAYAEGLRALLRLTPVSMESSPVVKHALATWLQIKRYWEKPYDAGLLPSPLAEVADAHYRATTQTAIP